MKRHLLFFATLMALFMSGCNNDKPEDMIRTEKNEPYKIMLNAEGKTLRVEVNNGQLSFPDFKGQAVMLEFFTTWCPSCIAVAPSVEKLSKEFSGKAVVIGVLVEEGVSNEAVTKYKNDKGLSYTITSGKANFDLARAIGGVRGVPAFYVFDKNHKLIARYTGAEREEIMRADLTKGVQ